MGNAIDIIVNATDKASPKIKKISGMFENLGSKAEKSMGIIGAIGTVAGAGLTAIAVAGVKMNATLEQSEAKWTTLLKGSEEAEKQMAWMKDYAKQTPFDYKSIDATATALVGMGLGVKDVNKWMPTLGDASAVLGGGSETVERLGRALGQMNAKGKVSAEEMAQISETGVNAWQMLADGMGITQGEVRKLSEDGKLLAKDALPLIYAGMEKSFGGGTQNLMKSTSGQAMQASENFQTLAGTLTQGAFDWFGATVLPMVNKGLEGLTSMFKGGLIKGFENLWKSSDKAKVGLIAVSGVLTGALIGAMVLIAPAVASAVVAFAPFLAIGLAVAGLGAIIIKYWDPIKAFFVNTFSSLFTAFSNFFTGIWTLVQPIVMQMVSYLMSKFQEFRTFWDEHWGMIKQAFVNIWTGIEIYIKTALNVILAIFEFVFPAIKFVVMSVWDAIKSMIDGALTFIMGIIKVFAGLFTGNWSVMWQGIKDMFWGAIQFIWGYIQLFFGTKILGVLGKFVGKGVAWIKGFADDSVKAISKFAGKVWDWIKTMADNVLTSIGKWVTDMVSKVDELVTDFIDKVVGLDTDMGNAMQSMWDGLKTLAGDGVKAMVGAIEDMGTTFMNAGKGLLEAFASGITSGFSKAKDAVVDGLKAIRENLPFSPAKVGPLSDLDKSGASFFPTFAYGMSKGVKPMLQMAQKGMSALNNELDRDFQTMSLNSFGASSRNTITVRHEMSGVVDVKGANGETQKLAMDYTVDKVQNMDFLGDFRQVSRSR